MPKTKNPKQNKKLFKKIFLKFSVLSMIKKKPDKDKAAIKNKSNGAKAKTSTAPRKKQRKLSDVVEILLIIF
jgi:hypothetical protein